MHATHGQPTPVNINGRTLMVQCDISSPNGPWIVIMRNTRTDTFRKTLAEYEAGFGRLFGDYFIGK